MGEFFTRVKTDVDLMEPVGKTGMSFGSNLGDLRKITILRRRTSGNSHYFVVL